MIWTLDCHSRTKMCNPGLWVKHEPVYCKFRLGCSSPGTVSKWPNLSAMSLSFWLQNVLIRESKAYTRRSKKLLQLGFICFAKCPANWLYCSIFLTKMSCSSLTEKYYDSTYLYQPFLEFSKKSYQVNMIRSVFPKPALIVINYILHFNSVFKASAIPACDLGSEEERQTHPFAGHFVYPSKSWPNRSYFPVLDFLQVQDSRNAQCTQSCELLHQLQPLGYKLFGFTFWKTSSFHGCCLISSVSVGVGRISSPLYAGNTSASLQESEHHHLLNASDFSLPLLF